MLVGLSIRDVVLIDRLDLTFGSGLSTLTGETGAGKSILLDALGLALGARAEAGLVRHGSERAVVTALFELSPGHAALQQAEAQGIDVEEGQLVLRRQLSADGRSRAFVNDQSVSVSLLRTLGESLVEVQGQFEQQGLLDPRTHRAVLDAFAGADDAGRDVARAWGAWRSAREARAEAARQLEQARAEEAFLRHALEELERLDPRPGEEEALAGQRQFLLHAERLVEAMRTAERELSGDGGRGGVARALAAAARTLEKVAPQAGNRLDPVLTALDGAAAQVAEAEVALAALAADLDLEPGRLAQIDDRFFALKDLARKHACEVDRLPDLRREMEERLAGIEAGDERLAELQRVVDAARADYRAAAARLADLRTQAAEGLDRAIAAELGPLRLDKARFVTRLMALPEAEWGPEGSERVAFEVATNPGAPPVPLAKTASGGELSRLLLAIKVVLAESGPVATMVFDEVDSGIGGATAAAVGERLARLAQSRQVLVVTHSPQVAARGRQHWQVRKEEEGGVVRTRLVALDPAARQEEVARMLSGAQITEAARAAARSLLAGAG